MNDEKLNKVPLLVFANKQDMPTCLAPDEVIYIKSKIINLLELSNIVDRDWCLYACSAIKGDGKILY
jgi:ADP-ribosylation factor-like protein 3